MHVSEQAQSMCQSIILEHKFCTFSIVMDQRHCC